MREIAVDQNRLINPILRRLNYHADAVDHHIGTPVAQYFFDLKKLGNVQQNGVRRDRCSRTG